MKELDMAALAAEFDMLAARAGLEVPADRRQPLFDGFVDLRRMLPLLRQSLTPTSDTAGVYRLDNVTRKI